MGVRVLGTETQSRMLDLLDQAYHVSEDVDRLDALLESANNYLFEDQKNAVVTKNLPFFADLDPHLEIHINRLEDLIARQAGQDKLGLSIEHHAQLILSSEGRVLTANTKAQNLLDGMPNAFLDNLPLSFDSLTALREILKEISAGVQNLERIVYLQIETDTPQNAFGFCRAVPVGQEKTGLHISLSYFDWSPAIFKSLQNALALSDSEGLVLQGILNGQNHKEIAQARHRSVDTIKTQAKAILRKAGCAKMTELAHLCTSIAYVIGLSETLTLDQTSHDNWITPRKNLHMLSVPDGRTLAYYEYGDPKGQPVLFIHGFFQGPFFLDNMIRGFLTNGFRVIAPSRPHFGYTSQPAPKKDYDTTTCADAVTLVNHLDLGANIIITAHHGGASHAFRLAKQIEQQVYGMMLIGAGIPLNAEHIRFMTKQARMMSVASRHAPSVVKLIATMGMKTYRKKGMQAFFEDHYAPSECDHPCIHDPEIQPKLSEGMFHLVQQGAEAFVHDGRSQMADWQDDLKAVDCPQAWVHGRHCHLMGAKFVADYVRSNTNHTIEILDDAGYNILYQDPARIIEALCALARRD